MPGKRESRRFIGDYILKQGDCERGEVFEDAVAYGGWSLDLHPPKGIYEEKGPFTTKQVPLYTIPFRSLYSRNVPNLLFAGRQISTSHVAFGSTRVMATCSVMGQAVGTAAALCAKHDCTPRELCRESIVELQQTLLKDDAYIIGASNSDLYDLARKADVRASSETPDGRAALVINGVARRTSSGGNCWVSDPGQALPQWIELRFPEAKRIREIHLTFDSGLKRRLMLTQSDGVNAQLIRGPQPETVRDYELEILSGESAKTIASVKKQLSEKAHPQVRTGGRVRAPSRGCTPRTESPPLNFSKSASMRNRDNSMGVNYEENNDSETCCSHDSGRVHVLGVRTLTKKACGNRESARNERATRQSRI